MKLVVLDEALAEAIEAADWYEGRQPGVGGRFLTAVDAALAEIEQDPMRFPLLETIKRDPWGLRRAFLDRFPYLVIYRLTNLEIIVVAIAHAHRRPGYWRDRLA